MRTTRSYRLKKLSTRALLSIGQAFLTCLNEFFEFTDAMFMAHPAYRAIFRSHKKDSLRIAIRRLEQKEMIVRVPSVPGKFMLTPKGKRYIDQVLCRIGAFKKAETIKNEFVWDGKWRILVFDVPEKRKKERRLLRYELFASGFRKMQRSVWISPHQVNAQFIERLNGIGKLGGNIEFVVAESISNEHTYMKIFSLKKIVAKNPQT
ncbi:MAG: hypothetical protein Q8Q39_02270 [bacterium]|nr:hypothetical protein [bacterium]